MGKTQDELEQGVKVYQLDAVETKVDQALLKLETILSQTAGLVTPAQLAEQRKDLENKIDTEVKLIHKEYAPMKKNIDWFTRAIILEGVGIVGQAILLLVILRK